MNGLVLLAWVVGGLFLYACYVLAVAITTAPVEPGEYSRLDELDGLPRDAAAHEVRMNARAERVGMNR